jgi:DNA-binding NtrC family response regulator
MSQDRQFTILCIHNDKAPLQIRAGKLESAGYHVLTALTADAAMAIFVQQEIDLVIAEQLVRGVSGAELSIFMKQVRPGVAVVLISERSLPSAVAEHVDAYVQKDCPEQEFLSCIKAVLGRYAPALRAV